jgi:hypothetical protein
VAGLFQSSGFPLPLLQAYLLPTDVNKLTFKNLTPDTQYVVAVFGYNASGDSFNGQDVTTAKK